MDRTLLVLLLAAAMICLGASRRPPGAEGGQPEELHWVQKTWWDGQFAVVLAGDSRMTEALAPQVLSPALGGIPVANFGFPLVSFADDYLAALDRVLDPAAPRRIVVLGLTPLSVTRNQPAPKNYFRETYARLANQRLSTYYLAPAQELLKPIGTKKLRNALRGRFEKGKRIYHANGWIETAPEPEKPRFTEASYHEMFARFEPAPEVQRDLLRWTKRWHEAGVEVIGFRPPVPDWMVELEDTESGYVEADLIQAFEAAGGRWIDASRGDWYCYDGSHLRADQALEFTEWFAAQLKR